MFRTVVVILVVAVLAGAAYFARSWVVPIEPKQSDPVRHVVAIAPSIERVREMAELVTMEAPISDVQVSKLEGYTGTIELVMAVHGDVVVGTDLGEAKYAAVDGAKRKVVLEIPMPKSGRPRLDHEMTRTVSVTRSGLWKYYPGETGLKTLQNRALKRAQRYVAGVAIGQDLLDRAREKAEKVIGDFYKTVQWEVEFKWVDGSSGARTASVLDKG